MSSEIKQERFITVLFYCLSDVWMIPHWLNRQLITFYLKNDADFQNYVSKQTAIISSRLCTHRYKKDFLTCSAEVAAYVTVF